jgi:HSP20 family protein
MAHEQITRHREQRQQSSGTTPQGATAAQPTAMERAGGGERGMTTRQYQDPFSVFDSLFERMQRDFFGTSLLNAVVPSQGDGGDGGRHMARMPRVQMRDSGDFLQITAEMPGIEGSNVSVVLEDDVLTISGEQQEEQEGDDARVARYVSFYRQLPLPDGIDAEQAEASYRDGVLTVRFPKTRARGSAREIPVTTQQDRQQSGRQSGQAKERAA